MLVIAAVAISSVIAVDAAGAAAALPRAVPPVDAESAPAGDLTAPDTVSAQVLADQRGVPVEDLSQRTEAGSVFALPDGSWATGQGAGPVWVRLGGDGTSDSDWAPVDLTLETQADGTVAPRAQAGDLTLSGGTPAVPGSSAADLDTSTELVSLTDPDTGVSTSVHWDGPLPAPQLSGRRATYENVEPGVDLVMEATSTGFEQFVVLNERPDAGEQITIPLTVTTAGGAQVQQTPEGGLEVVVDGQQALSAPPGQMWDADTDEARAFPITADRPAEDDTATVMAPMPQWVLEGDTNTAERVDPDQDQSPPEIVGDPSSPAAQDLVAVDQVLAGAGSGEVAVTLQPDEGFLQHPDTTYPVVIDPDVNFNRGFDTYVLSGYNDDRSARTDLQVGTYDGGTHIARSFVAFPMSAMAGKQIISARMELWNYYSWSCNARSWDVWRTGGVSSATRWSAQPGWYEKWATSSVTKGYTTACGGGWANVDVTSLVAQWAAQSAATGTVGVRATSESDNYGWKKFYAADNGSYIPSIWVTYNSAPGAPAGRSVSPCGSTCNSTPRYVPSTTPTLSAGTSDPEGGTLQYDFEVWAGSSPTPTTRVTTGSASAASGVVARWTVPAGTLADGSTYQYRVRAKDSAGLYGPWSDGWVVFVIDLPTAPVASQLAMQRPESHQPVLAARIDGDGGQVSAKFSARRQGATTWNLLNAVTVPTTSGQVARLALPPVPAGAAIEWQVQACDAASICSTSALQTGQVSPILGAGPRKNATALPFQLGDAVDARVDVGTGNLMVTASGLNALGITGSVPVNLVYNSLSLSADVPQAATTNPTGYGWTIGLGARLEAAADGTVVFHGPAGLTGTFLPAAGGTYTAPAGITADLATAAGGGWTLTDRASRQTMTFDTAGRVKSIADRNNNTVTVAYATGDPGAPMTTVTGNAGPTGARTISLTTTGGRITGMSQTVTGSARTVRLGYDSAGDLTTVTDALNRVTTLSYTGHRLTKVVAPGSVETHFTYDTRNRVTAVRQVNTSAGSPGDTWTRLAYTSDLETLVSDGAQEQAGSPTTGPHTTYSLDGERMTGRVVKVLDAEDRTRSTKYTANFDPELTTAGAGTTESPVATTTAKYEANNSESLTSVQSPAGATRGWEYNNTAEATKYLPTSSTDAAGQSTLYTYNGAGNAMGTTDAMGAVAALERNLEDGTVRTATAPDNHGNPTTYAYTNGQLTRVTPVTGSSLGVRDFTYDAFGRMKTATNGRGVTTTYSYDALDRVTGVDYSGTTPNPDVAYTYDTAGRTATRTDTSGTTTYTYDQLSNLTSRVITFDNKTVAYAYDKAGRLASNTDTGGATLYRYDTGGALTSMEYDGAGGRATTRFAVDDKGRRTDTWMQTNADNTVWAAHSKTTYDTSGRPSRILGERNAPSTSGGAPTTVVDLQYCYAAGSTYPTCSTAKSADRSLVQWVRDNVTGQLTTYTYDKARRLTGASTTAGNDPTTGPIAAKAYTYAYDARGNRTTATATGTPNQTRTHNPGNQITTAGFTYDGAGNLTSDPSAGAIAYTAGDQMASVTKGGTTYDYTYAGVGNSELLRNETPNDVYTYTYGADTAVEGRPAIEQVTVDGNTAHLDNDPTGQPIMLRTSTGQPLLYIYDNQGSPIALLSSFDTTAFQYSFDPYGVAKLEKTSGGNATGQTPFLYTGGLHDRTTGWIKQGARYYNPTEGRWTQYDTLDAPLDPLNANRYAYAANNPVNYVDATGLVTACGATAFTLTTIGVAASAVGLVASGPILVGVAAATGFSVGVPGLVLSAYDTFGSGC